MNEPVENFDQDYYLDDPISCPFCGKKNIKVGMELINRNDVLYVYSYAACVDCHCEKFSSDVKVDDTSTKELILAASNIWNSRYKEEIKKRSCDTCSKSIIRGSHLFCNDINLSMGANDICSKYTERDYS